MVSFGPFGDRLPESFEGRVWDSELQVRVVVRLSFDGTDRVRIDSVTVSRIDGESITPQDIARLSIAAVVAEVVRTQVWSQTPRLHVDEDLGNWRRDHDGPLSDDELGNLARIYWEAYVGWGNPRQRVMDAFGVPRSTASRWIRRARDRYGLPGPHGDGEG